MARALLHSLGVRVSLYRILTVDRYSEQNVHALQDGATCGTAYDAPNASCMNDSFDGDYCC